MKLILDTDQINRTIKRIAHEIIERNEDLNKVMIVGIKRKGVFLAEKLKDILFSFTNIQLELIELDILNYRDDVVNKSAKIEKVNIIDNKIIVLVDDVLHTGRTIRAAMDACIDLGRPKEIQLAVLIDRGHRELPIRPDFVGKNLPTSKSEKVIVDMKEFKVYIKENQNE